MTEKPDEGEFLSRVKQQLDESSERIDELTLARLGAARRRAVEAASRDSHWRLGDVLVAGRGAQLAWLAGGLLLLLLFLIPNLQTPQQGLQAVQLLDDMELLGTTEDLDFYRELDFYLWVADEQDKG